MTQKFNPRNSELTLGQANRQPVLSTEEEDLTKVIHMLLQAGTEH